MSDDFDKTPLVRTDFSDDAAWLALVDAASAESPDGFQAQIRAVNDQRFAGWSPARLLEHGGWDDAAVLFVCDTDTIRHEEHPILCVDLIDKPGRSFRCIPSELWGVENNLSLANMDWHEFAEAVDEKGIHRGF